MSKPDAAKPDATPRRIGALLLIWRHALAYKGHLLAAILSLLVAAAATLAIPSGFKLVIDRGFSNVDGDIGRYFRYLLLIVTVLAASTALRFYFVSMLGERVIADIRTATHRNLLTLAPRFFEENRPSEIASRLTADTSIIEQVVGTTVSVALRNLVIGIGGIIYLLTLAPKLTAMLLFGIPLVILPIMFLGRRVQKLSRSTQDRVATVGTIVSETLGAMKIVQAFGQEQREGDRFAVAVQNTLDTARSRIRLRAAMTAIVIFVIFGSITMIMWQGALDVAAGRISSGTIAAFVFTGGLVAGAFGALTEVYGDLLRGAGAAGRIAELMAEIPEIRAPAQPVALPQPAEGRLAFDRVSFRYPTRPEVLALDDFTLAIRPGEMVALVGPSGAGKSTIFQLAQRFYDPAGGVVSIDGVALPATEPAQIRDRIAMVPQETIIFAASARDNLRYGHWGADDAALWAAAETANAADFLRALPDGLDTYLGEGGARLSGGQRQRLAIARAVLRDAPLLLLDEATSALDAESEQLVQRALERLMANRTTLVIAHRLATIRMADRIVVMDGGRIVEEGTHADLTGRGGLYARLARLQFDEAIA
ncbi:MAG TPA: ABC transporter transmembrane domain-containing protein [Sphingomonas sp.]|jgi:ATP-binding cassette subfamily B protein|uniref:ABC transporter transmembrane domain-containing protein n=1 Tax=Sphingomonas sp. TaxID=28214 RepID=UPI002ED828AD